MQVWQDGFQRAEARDLRKRGEQEHPDEPDARGAVKKSAPGVDFDEQEIRDERDGQQQQRAVLDAGIEVRIGRKERHEPLVAHHPDDERDGKEREREAAPQKRDMAAEREREQRSDEHNERRKEQEKAEHVVLERILPARLRIHEVHRREEDVRAVLHGRHIDGDLATPGVLGDRHGAPDSAE